MKLLSKSKYLLGLQCPKYLWLSINEPHKIPAHDKGTQHRFDQGHLVGKYAKQLFPEGIDIPTQPFKLSLEKTKSLLAQNKLAFEAAFMVQGLYSRADILQPGGSGSWNIIEVKSGASVKDVNIHDLSFQKYVCELAGLRIDKCFLMHINSEYVRQGCIEPEKLLILKDVTQEVIEAGKGIKERIENMRHILALKECPLEDIGPRCNNPYNCPCDCRDHLPDDSIFSLYSGKQISSQLYCNGILKIGDIPEGTKLSDKQRIQVWCEKHKKPHVDKDAVIKFINELKEPLQFLDFETFSTAIPLYDGLRPYQRVPFQFSLHILENGQTKHISFLADGKEDPRREFISQLKKAIIPRGCIIAYFAAFEKGVLKELAEAYPEASLLKMNEMMIDLFRPFGNFHCYHPKQNGSASLKAVLPAWTGKSYEGMDISQGEEASIAYLDILTGSLNDQEIAKIRHDLEEYCELDTRAMIMLLEKLKELVNTY